MLKKKVDLTLGRFALSLFVNLTELLQTEGSHCPVFSSSEEIQALCTVTCTGLVNTPDVLLSAVVSGWIPPAGLSYCRWWILFSLNQTEVTHLCNFCTISCHWNIWHRTFKDLWERSCMQRFLLWRGWIVFGSWRPTSAGLSTPQPHRAPLISPYQRGWEGREGGGIPNLNINTVTGCSGFKSLLTGLEKKNSTLSTRKSLIHTHWRALSSISSWGGW